MCNVQVWDKVWSLSDVQYAYTHPEKLITDNSAVTSGTTISNLKAWYPCTEGNPRSPQTTVYDGSPKGLGIEMMDTGESTYETGTGSWTTVGTNTVTNVNEQVVITYVNTSNNASLLYFTADEAATVDTVDGKVYRLQLDAKYGGTPDSGVPSMKLRNESGDQSWNLSTTMTTYVRYFTDIAGGSPYLAPQNMAGTGTTVTVDNLSLKEVKMGNHGTTTFYGDEMITDSDNTNFADGTINEWVVETNGNGTCTYDGTNPGAEKVAKVLVGATPGTYTHSSLPTTEMTTFIAGKTYRITADVYLPSANNNWTEVSIGESSLSPAWTEVSATDATLGTEDAWQTIERVVVPGSDVAGSILIVARSTVAGDLMYIDNISIKEVGVSTGWTTADAEPLIPQTALMGMSKPMVFDGSDGKVSLGNPVAIDFGSTTDFSIGAWVKTSTLDATDKTIIGTRDGSPHRGWILQHNVADKLRFKVYVADGSSATAELNSPIADGELHHVMGVCDRDADIKLYVDGSLLVTTSTATNGGIVDTTENEHIGYKFGTWEGIINEVSIFTSALSLAQVQELFNDGVAFDLENDTLTGSPTLAGYWRNDGVSTWSDRSTNSNDGTVLGSPETILLPEGTTSGKDILGFPLTHTNNGWLNLNREEYVNAGSSSVFDNIFDGGGTIEAWLKIEAGANFSTGARFFTKGDESTKGWIIYPSGLSSGVFDFHFEVVFSGDDGNWGTSSEELTIDSWDHIAITYDSASASNEALFYVNGLVKGTNNPTPTGTYASDAGQDILIGNRSALDRGTDGAIDEVKIYNRILSAAEVLKNYKHGKGKHPN
jgi:hypothetical protein